MRISRLLLPLYFVFALLFAQQVGAAHVLRHTLEDLSQQNKHATHTACEECENFAQLSSALGVTTFDVTPPHFSSTAIPLLAYSFQSIHILTTAIRGPPALQKDA